jgi:hypothetical protein
VHTRVCTRAVLFQLTALPTANCTCTRAQGTSCFSEAETEQMGSLFSLNAEQLDLVLSGSAFIFEQAAYATTPPEDLRAELETAGLGTDAAHAFSSTWQLGAAECVQRLKDMSVLAPLQLSGVDWQLCVGTAASSGARGQESHTLLQLELSPPLGGGGDGGGGGGGGGDGGGAGAEERAAAGGEGGRGEAQMVHMRLGREDMSAFLEKLDVIQSQMDRLS